MRAGMRAPMRAGMRTPTRVRIGSEIGSPPTTPARENSTRREVPLYKSAETGLLLDEDSPWNTVGESVMNHIGLNQRTLHEVMPEQFSHSRRNFKFARRLIAIVFPSVQRQGSPGG
jgi:hypothetical protein